MAGIGLAECPFAHNVSNVGPGPAYQELQEGTCQESRHLHRSRHHQHPACIVLVNVPLAEAVT